VLIKLYQILVIILYPFILLFLLYRLIKGKEDPKRFFERFGFTKYSKPKLPVIWFHAASVGEFLALEHLIKLVIIKYPKHQILLTTATKSSAKLVSTKQIESLIHQIVPFDEYFSVKRFINHWQPVLSVFIESELWPCLIPHASTCGNVALVNARMTDKSYQRWLQYNSFFKEIIACFAYIDAQSSKDQQRIKNLGASNVYCSGNLKFNTQALAVDIEKINKLKTQIHDRPVFLSVSTHHNEEERLGIIHKKLLLKFPNLLSIIAPRHPDRCANIVLSLKELGIKNIIKKSVSSNIEHDTDVFIIDAIGELGNYFELTSIVFIGGSLVPIGGHNILEAAKLGKAIIVGKYMDNYSEITEDFLRCKALIQVADDNQLFETLSLLLGRPDLQQAYIDNSKDIIIKHAHTTEVIMHNLEGLLYK
jgi:3-deoxy-D-manno-octulosonic-acid transferase